MTARKKSSSDENDITKKVVGVTKKGGKKLIIDQDHIGYFFIKFADGGQLPEKLMGKYTRYEFAQDIIAVYLRGK